VFVQTAAERCRNFFYLGVANQRKERDPNLAFGFGDREQVRGGHVGPPLPVPVTLLPLARDRQAARPGRVFEDRHEGAEQVVRFEDAGHDRDRHAVEVLADVPLNGTVQGGAQEEEEEEEEEGGEGRKMHTKEE
jgi:hypothetical protein